MQESKSQSAGGLVDDAPLDMDLYNTPAVAAAAGEMEIHASSDMNIQSVLRICVLRYACCEYACFTIEQ